jgi:hypothetical protein
MLKEKWFDYKNAKLNIIENLSMEIPWNSLKFDEGRGSTEELFFF